MVLRNQTQNDCEESAWEYVLVLLIIVRVKVIVAHVQDDVIIIGIRAATCIQLVNVVVGEVGSHRVNKPGGICAMPPVIVIGVVRFL